MKKTRKATARNVIGRRILKFRVAARPPVSQDDLAARLARRGILIDRSAISRIESQGRYLMDYEIIAIARSLKVPVAKLFWGRRVLKSEAVVPSRETGDQRG